MRNYLLCLLLVIIVVGLTGCPKPKVETTMPPVVPAGTAGTEIKIFIPCGMTIPLREAAKAFMTENPGIKVTGIYDNAGIIVKRIVEKGEKADLVISPGSTELAKLEQAGQLLPGTTKPIGTFELVVLVPSSSTLEIKSPADLKKCKTIAMPDPDVNSVGTSGREALTKLGLYDGLKSRMFLPKHAIDAHTMVAAGKAQAGISYRNCPLETNPEKLAKSKVRIAFAFPVDSYTPQQCLLAQLKDGATPDAATRYLNFLTSPEGLKVLADNYMAGALQLAKPGGSGAPAITPAAKTAAPVKKGAVHVMAFYPGNEGHAHIKKMIEGLPTKYGSKVTSEFIDFTSDAGYERFQAAGMTCGGILINDEQTFSYDKAGTPTEVTFKQAMGGEWTQADLDAVIKKLVAQAK